MKFIQKLFHQISDRPLLNEYVCNVFESNLVSSIYNAFSYFLQLRRTKYIVQCTPLHSCVWLNKSHFKFHEYFFFCLLQFKVRVQKFNKCLFRSVFAHPVHGLLLIQQTCTHFTVTHYFIIEIFEPTNFNFLPLNECLFYKLK